MRNLATNPDDYYFNTLDDIPYGDIVDILSSIGEDHCGDCTDDPQDPEERCGDGILDPDGVDDDINTVFDNEECDYGDDPIDQIAN